VGHLGTENADDERRRRGSTLVKIKEEIVRRCEMQSREVT
jgi:hypothetical protein